MSDIELVVFDIDGTMLNTFEHIVQAFEVVLPQHNVKPDREAIRQVIGLTLIDCYKVLVPGGNHEAMRELHHETQQTPEMYALITAYDGLRETLELLEQKGVKRAVQTNRSRQSVDLIFDHVGIGALFDFILTPDEVSKPKPNPEGIQLISKQLEVPLNSMVMVGDTHIDILTGINGRVAGTIGLTHGFGTREELEKAGASQIIDSFTELPTALNKIGEMHE
jgi:HAD superfamily hydrolase (TIGR01549 family)